MIREEPSVALASLGNGAAIKLGKDVALTTAFRIIKSIIHGGHVDGLTSTEGIGLTLGICNGDLTAVEIAEALSAAPLQPSDRVETERAERFVKIVGSFVVDSIATQRILQGPLGGSLIEVVLRWTFSKTDAWEFFVMNNGPTLTTGATVRLGATHYGVWVQ